MRLPTIGGGQVQSLGRVDPNQKARVAAAPYSAASSILSDTAKMADFGQSLTDQKESMQAGNKAIAESGQYERLTSQEFVNSQELPPEVQAQMAMHPSGTMSDTGDMTYPQDAVGPMLSEYYSGQIKAQEDSIQNNRSRQMYNKFVGETVGKNVSKGQSNVVMAQVAAGKREYDNRVDAYMVAGDLDAALETIGLANTSRFYTANEADKQRNSAYKRSNEQYDQAIDNEESAYINAIADNNPVAAAEAKAKAEQTTADALKHGDKVIPKEEAAERIRQLDVAGDAQYTQQHVIEILNGPKGFVGAQQTVIELRTNPEHRPDNTTQEEWDSQLKAIDSMLNKVQGDKDRVAKKVLDYQTERAGSQQLAYLMSKGQTVTGHKDASKAADSEYMQGINNLANSPPAMRLNYIRDFVAATKYIPKGLNQQLDSMIASDDTNSVLEAAQIFQTLRTDMTTRTSAADVRADKQALLIDVADAARYYSTEDLAGRVASLTDRYYSVDKGKSEIYLGQNSKALKDDKLMKDFNSKMSDTDMYGTGWFGGDDPKSTTEAYVAWKFLVEDQIKSGASMDAAKETANLHVKNKFAITHTDPAFPQGKMMRNAPESKGKWATDQWATDKNKIFGSYEEEFGAENVYLESSGISSQRADQTGQRYKVMVRTSANDEFTAQQAINEDGTKSYWQPNYNSTAQATEQQTQSQLDSESIQATKDIVNFARVEMTQAIKETVAKTPQVRADVNMTVYDATEEIFDDAEEQLKTDPSMYDQKMAGYPNREMRPVLNQARYDRALKQLKLARNQATETVGMEQDKGFDLPSAARKKPKLPAEPKPDKVPQAIGGQLQF